VLIPTTIKKIAQKASQTKKPRDTIHFFTREDLSGTTMIV